MKYHFLHIENGQIAEGYTAIDINDYEAEIGNDDAEAILLAGKNGGELAAKVTKLKVQGSEIKTLNPEPETRDPEGRTN